VSVVDIDTRDPQVRRLMGLEQREQERFAREVEGPGIARQQELVHIAGDADTGMTSTINLAGGKAEVFALYRGRCVPPEFPDGLRLTIDVYAIPGESIQVHLICPKCRQQLRATSDRKTIEWEPRVGSADGGRLEVSPFQCTWEMPEAGQHTPGILGGGLSLCNWKGVIEHVHGRNIVRDA
jgi:hypothetical protein